MLKDNVAAELEVVGDWRGWGLNCNFLCTGTVLYNLRDSYNKLCFGLAHKKLSHLIHLYSQSLFDSEGNIRCKPLRCLFFLHQVWWMDGFHKGRRVQEYRTMGDFTKGQNFVQHLLPHPWAGTGHVVYNGSLYYNKHQSNILVGGFLDGHS